MDNIAKLEVFNVLNFINKGYEIDYIFDKADFSTFKSLEECVDYLTREGFLSGGDELITAEELAKMKVTELKEHLKARGMKVSGKKQELIDRLLPVINEKAERGLDAFREEETACEQELTEKAKEFLAENEWIDLYMFALVFFDFNDYVTYYEASDAGNVQTALNFCDEVISRSLMTNNFMIFIDALSAKAHVYAYDKDYDSFLDYDLQRYILGLNPIFLEPQTYATYEIINKANITNIGNVVGSFDMGSLRKRFNKIWNKSNIQHATVPKKTCFKLLERAIAGADIDELNFELRVKYFDKKFGIQ